MFKAFIFDLNGTMIDDMEYHVEAWCGILNNDLNAGLSYNEVKKEMYGKNQEVLIRIFGEGKFSVDEMNKISFEKETRYQKAFLPELKLIKGLDTFLHQAHKKQVKMAIASAAITFNIDFVLDNLKIRHFFNAIVSADHVTTSKPHPETFLNAAKHLQLKAEECVVFEDAPKGVEAALNAGMKTVVLTTMHDRHEFDEYNNIIGFAEDYEDSFITSLL